MAIVCQEKLTTEEELRDVISLDGQWTIKYFQKGGKEVILKAANPEYPVIRPKSELCLGGIVTAVIRKYHR